MKVLPGYCQPRQRIRYRSFSLTHVMEIPRVGPMVWSTVSKMYRNTEEATTPKATRAMSQMLMKISDAAVKVVVAMMLVCTEGWRKRKHYGQIVHDTT